jgi:hypothetical protein
MNNGWRNCPQCGRPTLPAYAGSGWATVCQNPDCRAVINSEGRLIGRWTPGYGQFEAASEEGPAA